MKRFVVGVDRDQSMLFPSLLDDFIAEDNPFRAIETFVKGLDLKYIGFKGVDPHYREPTAQNAFFWSVQ